MVVQKKIAVRSGLTLLCTDVTLMQLFSDIQTAPNNAPFDMYPGNCVKQYMNM